MRFCNHKPRFSKDSNFKKDARKSIRFSGHGELAAGDVKNVSLGMTVRIGKKESPKKVASKIRKVTSRSKKINWDKYVGKIKFPVDALTYQRKVRDEWAG